MFLPLQFASWSIGCVPPNGWRRSKIGSERRRREHWHWHGYGRCHHRHRHRCRCGTNWLHNQWWSNKRRRRRRRWHNIPTTGGKCAWQHRRSREVQHGGLLSLLWLPTSFLFIVAISTGNQMAEGRGLAPCTLLLLRWQSKIF